MLKKKDIIKVIKNDKKMSKLRLESAEFMFLYSSLFFFLNYFLLASGINDGLFGSTIYVTLSIFVVSFFYYTSFLLISYFKDKLKGSSIVIYALMGVACVLTLASFFVM